MQFCGLTILTDKQFSEEKAAAAKAQRELNVNLIASLLWNAEQYRIVAQGLLGREVRLPRRPH
jgi:hypothetical protein